MEERFFIKEMPNGMTLLGQPMEQVSSAAMMMLIPAGAAHDPPGCEGAAAVASEWMSRGAGDRDTRQLNDALDSLGAQHDQSVLSEHVHLGSAQLGRNLQAVLEIFADIVRRPRLAEAAFGPSRDLTIQDLAELEDEPMRKCNVLLREKFYPHPLGRCAYGTAESLQAMTPDAVRAHLARRLTPRGTILAVAGKIDWQRFCDLVGKRFGDWDAEPNEPVRPAAPAGGVTFIEKPTAQAQIALAHRSVTVGSEHYYPARVAETILSGGMSGRLFTEVREKRGLAYSVSSRYQSLKDHAGMFTYAGTRPELAQQTFDVTIAELRRLAEGIEPDELTRAKTQLKSGLVMASESTSGRAGALASDWYHLGRVRTLAELSRRIDEVTAEQVLDYLRAWPPEKFTVLVIGPEPLDTRTAEEA